MATWRKVVVSGSDAHLSTLEIGTAGAVAGTLINRSTVAGSLITGSYTGSYQGGTIDNTIIGGTTAAAGTFTSIVGTSLDLNGDMDLSTQATDIDLVDNNASALSFDAAGQAGILEIDTQDGSEKVKMAKGLDVDGATLLDQVTIDTADGAFNVAGAGAVDLDSNVDIDNATTAIDATTSHIVTSPIISFVGAITGSTHLSSSAQSTASFGQLDLQGNLTAASGTFSHLRVNGNITASVVYADAFTSRDGNSTIDFNDSVDMEDGLTVHGNTALGDAIGDTVTTVSYTHLTLPTKA